MTTRLACAMAVVLGLTVSLPLCPAAGPPADSSAWLNVRDCGASGSEFETTATTTDGSKQITVANVGDFQVGQGAMVSRCNIRYMPTQLWGTGQAYYNTKKVENSVEMRGYDGTAGSWLTFVLDIAPGKREFRWTDDLGRNWHPAVPITNDWQPLSGGVEVRLNERDWESGYVIAFGARDQLVTTIEKIGANVLTLKDPVNRSVKDAVVRHCDDAAIRAAVDRAIKEKRNVFVPIGHYRLAHGIPVRNADAITIEGASAVDTVLDISDGEGSCFSLSDGTEVTLRNFRMVGFMGFDEADRAGNLNTRGAAAIWGMSFKPCNAVSIGGTERVLVENCHASRMSVECFVSGGPSRGTVKPGRHYSQAITYLRCSATDCARNGFNDVMCGTENTSVLYCRIVDVGGCSWEGASRFVKFIGNYVRNSGPVAIGNLGPANRDKTYPDLGAGQHIVADNVFEGGVSYGGRAGGNAICTSVGSTQVIVRNNLFINFNSSGVTASGATDSTHYPAANTTIMGNIFDLTCVGQKPVRRTAVDVSSNDAIVSGNQIYVRGQCDPMVTGIRLHEPALNVNVHDNLIRNCGQGILTERGQAQIAEVVDDRTFLRAESPPGLPLERVRPWQCSGWTIAWLTGNKPTATSIIESFDPETLRFRLREPHERRESLARAQMKAGDRFDVIAPSLNWHIHDNTVTGCLNPVILDSYGSETSDLNDNIVSRGDVTGVKQAVVVRGRFNLIGNCITGFDERDSSALALSPDPLGRVVRNLYRGNIFERCANVVTETQKGMWDPANAGNNVIVR